MKFCCSMGDKFSLEDKVSSQQSYEGSWERKNEIEPIGWYFKAV